MKTKKQELNFVHRAGRNRTIFISRYLSEESPFIAKLTPLGYEVVGQSLINITPIRFTHTPPAKWVFFSSKNAIKHFFGQEPSLEAGTKFGVMGKSSAEYLAGFEKRADFIGEGNDVKKIAKDFAARLGNDSVLFPQAIESLQSIQKEISFRNVCYNLYVYKTSPKPDFNVPGADVLVFTSPSNVAAYLGKYPIRGGQRVIAIGASTMNKLKESGIKEVKIAPSFDEDGLAEAVMQSLN